MTDIVGINFFQTDRRTDSNLFLRERGFVKLSKWLTQRYGTGVGRDDLIDACACVIAARDSRSRLGGDEVDVRGLRMEINY